VAINYPSLSPNPIATIPALPTPLTRIPLPLIDPPPLPVPLANNRLISLERPQPLLPRSQPLWSILSSERSTWRGTPKRGRSSRPGTIESCRTRSGRRRVMARSFLSGRLKAARSDADTHAGVAMLLTQNSSVESRASLTRSFFALSSPCLPFPASVRVR
jgi:hypothetical protein